jgi:transcriptional regulator with XRE-family HTH domain
VPRFIVDPRFRAVLANLLVDRGITQARLAREANVSRSHLSEILNGAKQPSEQMARALERALDADGQLSGLIVVGASAEDLDQLAGAAVRPNRIGVAALDSLARVLAAQRQADDLMGSAAVLGPTVAQMDTVTHMVAEATGPTRQRLLYEAGQWAQFCAWLHISVGKHDGARSWLSRALEWAVECGDPDLTATVLSYQAHAAWLLLHPGPTIGLAGAALRDERVCPQQRAYDLFQSARAYAAMGELVDAEAALVEADAAVERCDSWSEELPPWQYYRGEWLWRLERGLVWEYYARHDRRQVNKAVAELRGGLDAMPGEMRGSDWYAEYLVHLAAVYRSGGSLAQAWGVLADARTIAANTKSSRVLRQVATQERALRLAGSGDRPL